MRDSRRRRSRNSASSENRSREQLQRDTALEPRVAGPVDLAHAAPADEPLDLIAGDRVAGRDVPFHRHRPTSRRS